MKAAGPERRKALRRRAYLAGKVAYGNGAFTLGCVIRDISELGSQIRLPAGLAIPGEVYLIDVTGCCAYDAHVVWRRSPDFGLAFGQKYSLDENCPASVRHLRRVLIDASVR